MKINLGIGCGYHEINLKRKRNYSTKNTIEYTSQHLDYNNTLIECITIHNISFVEID